MKPVLQGVHWYNNEYFFGFGVSQKDINEANDLDSLAKTHTVCQDTTESITAFVTIQRLHQVIIKEANATNLQIMGVNVTL